MPTIYIRDVPSDLYQRIKKIKDLLECKGWVSFLYEACRILEIWLEEEKGVSIR